MSKIRYVFISAADPSKRRDVMMSQEDGYKIIGERVMTGWPVRQTDVTDCPDGSRVSVSWQLSFDDMVWCVYIEEV